MTSILELDDFWQHNREPDVRNSNYSVCNNKQHHLKLQLKLIFYEYCESCMYGMNESVIDTWTEKLT